MKQFMTRMLMALALMGSASAQAAFIGDFASGDWTKFLTGTVTVNTPDSITLSDEVVYQSKVAEEPQIIVLELNPTPNSPLDICINNVCVTYTDPGNIANPLNPGDFIAISNPQGSNDVNLIPEPATPALLGAGLLFGLALFGRRKSN